jgi:adenylate cyclase
MKWWARSSLRTKIFLAFAALLLGSLIATLGFTQLVVRREAERTLGHELLTTGEVFGELVAERAARLETNSVLLTSDFALKRVIATYYDPATYDPDTLDSAAQNYRERIGVELLWITDDSGVLLAGASPRAHAGTHDPRVKQSIARFAPLKEALATSDAATGIADVDGALFQIVAVPVYGPDIIGYLVLGQAIDDAFARRLEENTGSDVSFLTANGVFASSWPEASRARVLPSSSRDRAALLREHTVEKPLLLTIEGERYLSLVVPVQASLTQPLYALVQGSYDRALAPLRALQLRIAVIGVAALFIALLTGVALAGGITSPVKTLAAGMREVLKGNLRYRSDIDREDEIGFMARSFNEMIVGLEEREHIKDTFGRFVSHDVAEAVLGGRVPLEGERREVSILFQDIRGFTALSARLDPAALLRLLNQFFTEAVAAVEAEGGVVKQFTGDGVMALFGAPQVYEDHPQRAARAALGIVERLGPLNQKLREQGYPALSIGAGVNMGAVVAGLIGPDERVEYGVVGEAVNLAARIESLTKELQAVVLVSKEIADRLGPGFELGRSAALPVKGSALPLQVVEVLGYRGAVAALA